jgi:thiol:disulfide interchange protein DsbD
MNAMHRRRSSALVFLVLLALTLVPAVAFAQDGSDTGAFTRYAAKGGLFALGASFVAGIAASLTPCVFPMVPITVALFGATESTSRSRGAALSATFVLGIACLFTPLGMAFAVSGKLLGSSLANPIVVSCIAALFFGLAASMFGAFEMALPSSVNNRLSTVGGVGFRGAFVLGLVMGLIAAPCTGPFLTGMVLWLATTKNMLLGASAMFLFAIGLGMPFFIAGAFAVSLPKGGAWMLGIKWASGVVLAYMALSYLRDGFPPVRKVVQPTATFGAVAGVMLAIGLVLGSIHIAAERRKSPIAHLSKPMKLASIVPAIVGMFLTISWMNMPKVALVPDAMASGEPPAPAILWQSKEAPAMELAQRDKKPVIIDFGAEWCTACKELDERTWPDPRVRSEAKRFVTVKIDATDEDDPETKRLTKKFGVVGLPTVVVLDSQGKEKVRFTEFAAADKMVQAIKAVN